MTEKERLLQAIWDELKDMTDDQKSAVLAFIHGICEDEEKVV